MGGAGKQAYSSFSYPMGRSLKVWSAGMGREWNQKSNSGGEGIWILSNTGGTPHVSAAGSMMDRKRRSPVTEDIVGLDHDPSGWPEAYLGPVANEDYALAIRKTNGVRADWTTGINSSNVMTNWWPAAGEIGAAPAALRKNKPAIIWNFRYGRYNSGTPFADRIAAGELAGTEAPPWAQVLSEDDFPELIGIQRARSTETGLQWTRKWYAWGHADYDDSLINETVVQNTSDGPAEGVYIVLQNRFSSHFATGYRGGFGLYNLAQPWSRDDYARSTLALNYLKGISPAKAVVLACP